MIAGKSVSEPSAEITKIRRSVLNFGAGTVVVVVLVDVVVVGATVVVVVVLVVVVLVDVVLVDVVLVVDVLVDVEVDVEVGADVVDVGLVVVVEVVSVPPGVQAARATRSTGIRIRNRTAVTFPPSTV